MIDAGQAIAYLDLDTSGFKRGITAAKQLVDDLGNKTLSASTKVKTLGGALTSVGKIASLASASIVTAGTVAVKSFATFDDAIRQVQATMGLTAETVAADIATLRKAATELGGNQGPVKAAEALNYLAAAGYDTTNAVAALPKVLTLAQAGGASLGTAADLATGSMTALGMSVGQLGTFVDQLAVAASASNASVVDMGQGILTVGGTAKTLAGGVVELTTQLGILADNGIKGAEGGTALRNMILALSAPVDSAKDKIKELGVKTFDAQGNFRATNEIFAEMHEKLSKMTADKRIDFLSAIFNKVDLKSAEALLANAGGRFDELSGQIRNADGAAQQMADTMEGGIGGSFRSLSAAVQTLSIEFGEKLAPTVGMAAEWVTNLTQGFSALPEATQSSIVNIAAWTAAAGPMLLVGGKLISMFGALIGVMSGPVGWVTLGVAGVAALTVAMDKLGTSAERALAQSMRNVNPADLAAYKKAFGKIDKTVDVSVTSNVTLADPTSLYDKIFALLTDGKPDTAEQTKTLQTEAQAYYDELVGAIKLDTDTKLAALKEALDSGVLSLSDYQTQADAVIKKNDELMGEAKGILTATEEYIKTMSGKSTETVLGAEDQLQIIADRSRKLYGEIMDMVDAANAADQNRSVKLVKAGASDAPEDVAKAFGAVHQEYALKRQTTKTEAEKKRESVNAAWEKEYDAAGKATDSARRDELRKSATEKRDKDLAAIQEGEEAAVANAKSGYMKHLNDLFEGLGKKSPEAVKQLSKAFEGVELSSVLDGITQSVSKGVKLTDTQKSAMTQALTGTMFEGWSAENLEKELQSGGPMATEIQAALQQQSHELMGDAAKQIAQTDTGTIGIALHELMAQGLLDGTDIDTGSLQGMLTLALGKLDVPKLVNNAIAEQLSKPSTPDAPEVPITAAPNVTVEPAEVDASKVQPAVEQAVTDSVADQTAPVSVDVTANVTVSGAGSGAGAVAEMAAGIEGAKGDAVSAASGVAKAAATALGGQTRAARTAGANLGAGFVSGMSSKLGAAISQAAKLARAAINAIDKEAENASPSKATMRSGAWTGEASCRTCWPSAVSWAWRASRGCNWPPRTSTPA